MGEQSVQPTLTRRTAGVLDNIQRADRPPFHTMSPRQTRRVHAMSAEILDLPRARVEALQIPSGDGAPRRSASTPPASRSAATVSARRSPPFAQSGRATSVYRCGYSC